MVRFLLLEGGFSRPGLMWFFVLSKPRPTVVENGYKKIKIGKKTGQAKPAGVGGHSTPRVSPWGFWKAKFIKTPALINPDLGLLPGERRRDRRGKKKFNVQNNRLPALCL
jgi:hypothetical protein